MPVAWQSAVRRTGIVVLAVVALAAVHVPGRPSTLCLLRASTGVPCPFCGGTTAGVELGRGDVLAAVRASPIAVAAAAAFALAPFGLPTLGRYRWLALGLAVLAAELWQLQRFGFL